MSESSETKHPNGEKKGGKHALIIGASMAGLMTARVLSEYFHTVTVIERDILPEDVEARKGVPQGHHVHALLHRGMQLLSELFPGLFEELQREGGVIGDFSQEVAWFHFGAWKKRTPSGMTTSLQSRVLLESTVRKRVKALGNVHFVQDCDVLHLMATPDKSRITGIQFRRHTIGELDVLENADLVVDASGRSSHTPEWLEQLGYARVPESNVQMEVGYTSRIYKRPEGFNPAWKMLGIYPQPPHGRRMGIVIPIEANKVHVSLCGWLKDHAPLDDQGFLEYAKTLPQPELYELVKTLEPDGPIRQHKVPSSQRRHYEQLDRFPERLVVLGDALCSFNPTFAQGITVAAMSVKELESCVREHLPTGSLDGLSNVFRKRVVKQLDDAWQITTGEDFRFPEVTGPKPLGGGVLGWYVARIHALTSRDAEVMAQFMRVMHLMSPPTSLLKPNILFKALTGLTSDGEAQRQA
jgi:2-polyprenyl-6-methoxyphenol hydroxylase-like FAD-dependent oxidoreductase